MMLLFFVDFKPRTSNFSIHTLVTDTTNQRPFRRKALFAGSAALKLMKYFQ